MATEPTVSPNKGVDSHKAMEDILESLRIEEDKGPVPLSQRERHKSLWYSTGNVVLVTSKILFRVYDGILAQHSPTLRDRLLLARPDVEFGQELVDVPVIHLDDDPTELSHFFSALYDRLYVIPIIFHSHQASLIFPIKATTATEAQLSLLSSSPSFVSVRNTKSRPSVSKQSRN